MGWSGEYGRCGLPHGDLAGEVWSRQDGETLRICPCSDQQFRGPCTAQRQPFGGDDHRRTSSGLHDLLGCVWVELRGGNSDHEGVIGAQRSELIGGAEDVDCHWQGDAREASRVDAGAAQERRLVGCSSEQLDDGSRAPLTLLLAPEERQSGSPCTCAENADRAHGREAGFAFAGARFVDFEVRPRSRPSSASRSRTTMRIGVPMRGYFSRI